MSTEDIEDLVSGTRRINLNYKLRKVENNFGVFDLSRMLTIYWSSKPWTPLPPMYIPRVESEIKNILLETVLVKASNITLMTPPCWARSFHNIRKTSLPGKMKRYAYVMKISIADFFNGSCKEQHSFWGTVKPGYDKQFETLVPKWQEGKIPTFADDFAKVVFFLAEISKAEVEQAERIDDLGDRFSKTKAEEEENGDDSSSDDSTDRDEYYDPTFYIH